MKKITLLLALCGLTLAANAIYPQTLPIDYSQFFAASAINVNGTDLVRDVYANQTPTPVPATPILANEWTFQYAATPLVSPTVEASTLSYSNYIDNNLGKAIVFSPATPTRNNAFYPLTSSSTAYTGKPFYMSMLINMSSFRSADPFLMFGSQFLGTFQRGKVQVVTNGAGYSLGVQFNTETAVNGTTLLNKNQTYLVVAKITPAAALGTEIISVFVNPVIGDLEPVTPEATTSITPSQLLYIKGINIRATFTGKMAGMRFSDNWTDVVKPYITKLTAPAVQVASAITATSFTANWTADANAVSYDVNLYLGSNLYSTTNVSGQASNSLAIFGLPSGLIYNYKVTTKGNGTTYGDSDPSLAKEVATTATANVATINTNFGDGNWGTVTPTPSTNLPANGSYPSSSINGFDFSNALVYGFASTTCPKGVTHINSVILDIIPNPSTLNTQGKVDFATLTSVEQIEIHANCGSGSRTFYLKELVGNAWTTVGTFTATPTEQIFTATLSRTVPTKFRIEHAGYSALYISQIIAHTNIPALLSTPVVGAASGIATTSFTANWTQVANASGGYRVLVYDAVPALKKSLIVTSQTTESKSVTGLVAETTYTYKVAAIGDGEVTYSDSYLSVASAPVTPSTSTALKNANVTSNLSVIEKNIVSSEIGEITVYNLQGKQLLNAKNVNSLNTNLGYGLYIVRFTNNSGQTQNKKFSF